MGKQKKKRNKVYAGQGATVTRPTVTRLAAVNRNPMQEWWHEKKRFLKPVLIVAATAIAIIWLLIELVRVVLRSGA